MITYITSEVFLLGFVMVILNLLFAPLGCVTLWQRQSYFCEGLAHSCFLASAISAITGIPIVITVLAVSMILAFLLHYTKKNNKDNVIVNQVIVNGMVALSIVLLQIASSKNAVNINNLFFGDILAVGKNDIVIISILAVFIVGIIYCYLNHFILASFNYDLAFSRGLNPFAIELMLLISLSLVAAFTLKIVGTLLISALIVITPAIARLFSKTPRQMIAWAVCVGISTSLLSLVGAVILDVPPAALATLLQALIFIIATIISNKRSV